MKKFLIAAALFMCPTVAHAELTTYGEAGGWIISQDKSECFMSASFKNDSNLHIGYDSRLNTVTVGFTDASAKSLNNGDERKLDTFFASSPNTLDDGWKDKTFTVAVNDDGERIFFRQMSAEFLTDMAKYEKLAFFYGDVLLRSYNLEGSALGIQSLRACAAKMARINPSDPFAGGK
jgi:hypothetical protein